MKTILIILILSASLYANTPAELAQIDDAINENIPAKEHRETFKQLITAIRKIENGSAGREFGILNDKAKTYRDQAGWCAATCWKNWIRWNNTDKQKPYIVFLACRYAPVGVENDPNNLNKNWLTNLMNALEAEL